MVTVVFRRSYSPLSSFAAAADFLARLERRVVPAVFLAAGFRDGVAR
jgi:hypothetical protein